MLNLSRFSAHGFDRGASKSKELAWYIIRRFFFQTAWPMPSIWRVRLLRLFGATIGEGVVIRAGINITFPWRLKVGDYVWLGEEVLILSLAQVTIESNSCISQRAFLCTGSHNFRVSTFDLQTAPITIRQGSWVAAQAFIGPGVEIGEGSVISAGCVIMKDVAAHSHMRGNPAEFVRSLEVT